MRNIAVRLCGALTLTIGLWTLIWLPLVGNEGVASELQERALGDDSAPVTIIEYSSLTCPHCAQFHTDVLPDLKERYILDGKVRLVLRDFPLDQRALEGAVLAHCGGERYFTFIDMLFKQQAVWAQADDLVPLRQIGKLGGLSDSEMDACFADESLVNGILQTRLDAQDAYDIRSTPTFVIGDEAYAGSRSADDFADLIDPLLN